MKVLFLCSTPFQVITALNIWLFQYPDDTCYMVLSDCFEGYEKLAERLREQQIFESVETVRIKKLLRRSKVNILKSVYGRKALISEFSLLDEYCYDHVLFYNFDMFSCCVYDRIIQVNPSAQFYRFEEGVSTYYDNLDQMKSCAFFERTEKIRHHKYLSANVDGYWYYHTDLARYKHDRKDNLFDIPLLSRENQYLKEILNDIFEVADLKDEYTRKNIFFEGCSHYDNDEVNDVEIVTELADFVGKANFEIKLHPRSTVDRFVDLGLKTNNRVGVPWELVQLNRNFCGYHFFTVASASVLASKLYFTDDVKIIFLYKCTNRRPKPVTEEFDQYLEKVREKFGGENIFVPENMQELYAVLSEDAALRKLN